MDVILRPELEEYLKDKVRDGQFTDLNTALNYAVELLRAEDARFADNADELRQLIAVGVEQADRGDFVEFDGEEIKAEGRRILAARKA